MQQDLNELGVDAWVLGIDGIGFEDSHARIVEGRSLAWLQDTQEQAVWETWGVAYRDVVILDAESMYVDVFNLTSNPITDEDNYASLLDLLVETAD